MNKLVSGRCLYCNKELSGRLDKKFCDVVCRNTYNNTHIQEHERQILLTNRQLRKNRTILKTLCPTGKATIRKSILMDLGFDFNVFSTIFPHRRNVYYFSYEYGFMPTVQFSHTDQTSVQKVVIVQKQEYMLAFDPWKFSVPGKHPD